MKYRKKPVVIEAIQFTGQESADEIMRWAGTPPVLLDIDPANGLCLAINVETLEGTMRAIRSDWIIRGVAGEFYPCRPDIFAATYEPVEDAA